MPKVSKTYSAPYNGISEQNDELVLDVQCRDMVNCIPDVVLGVQRRNGTEYIASLNPAFNPFHSYDRGEGDEQYIVGIQNTDLAVYDLTGTQKTVNYVGEAAVKGYLGTDTTKLKAITVQDRTFILNTTKVVGVSYENPVGLLYDRSAYYWLSRSSNDSNNEYRYAVYLDSYTFQTTDKDSTVAATELATLINASGYGFTATAKGSLLKIVKTGYGTDLAVNGGLRTPYDTDHKYVRVRPTVDGADEYVDVTTCDTVETPFEDTLCYKMTVQNYYLEVTIGGTTSFKTFAELEPLTDISVGYYKKLGSNYVDKQLKIIDVIVNTLGYFTFSYWDSWGSQASFGWKGQVAKLSDLPNEITIDNDYPIVKITGNDSSEFTTYYVQWNGRTWEETYNPEDTRGELNNMPIRVDRLADGTFEAALIDWATPNIGDINTNATPSFVDKTITEVFFFKNRLGLTSGDNLVLSQLGSYYDFYSKTSLEVLDTDPIDVTISTNKASKIYDVTPFQGQLYMMTKDEQFTIEQQNSFSPLTVSVVPVSSYSVDQEVEPVVVGDSMFFVSLTDASTRQLREYRIDKNSLTNIGTNVSITTPRLLPTIKQMVASTGNSSVMLLDSVDNTKLYMYRITKNGEQVIQSSWSRWSFGFGVKYMFFIDDVLHILTTQNKLLKVSLVPTTNTKLDEVDVGVTESFDSHITLHKWLPKIAEDLKTSLVPVQITRVSFYASGKFDVGILRESYNYTYTRTFDSGSTANMSATITSKSDDVVITIKNSDDENFILSSIIFEGFYTPPTREIK